MQTSLTRESLVHKNAMRDVAWNLSHDEKYGGCHIFVKEKFSEFVFLKGGGTAIIMPDGRERDEAIMEARLRLENQHLRLVSKTAPPRFRSTTKLTKFINQT